MTRKGMKQTIRVRMEDKDSGGGEIEKESVSSVAPELFT
jgi:hypothetical protein